MELKTYKITAISLVTSALLIGCGGGNSTSTESYSKITGTVPGTLIEAFCDNNYYAQVTSTNNGTNEHPFEINVPQNTNCKLIMTTNENDPANRVITEIGFSNGSTIVLNSDVNLGNIPLEMSYQNADDRDGDHVVDMPLQVNEKGASSNNTPVHDADGNGMVDAYDDHDDDNIPNAYEDDDKNGIANIHDDSDGNGKPDYMQGQDENMNQNDGQNTNQNDGQNTNQNDGQNTNQNDGQNTNQNDGQNTNQNDGQNTNQNDDSNNNQNNNHNN